MQAWKTLLNRIFSKDRRHAQRMSAPQLAAYYWTGAAPQEHRIRDISSAGLYLLTEDRWYPGTLVLMTLQMRSESETPTTKSISVQAKVVRCGEDGAGIEFLLPDHHDPRRGQSLFHDGADRKSLEKFLHGFALDRGSAIVNYVVGPHTQTNQSTEHRCQVMRHGQQVQEFGLNQYRST
jgi:hypothetical protein